MEDLDGTIAYIGREIKVFGHTHEISNRSAIPEDTFAFVKGEVALYFVFHSEE